MILCPPLVKSDLKYQRQRSAEASTEGRQSNYIQRISNSDVGATTKINTHVPFSRVAVLQLMIGTAGD